MKKHRIGFLLFVAFALPLMPLAVSAQSSGQTAISQLPAVPSVVGTDYLIIDHSGATYKGTVNQLFQSPALPANLPSPIGTELDLTDISGASPAANVKFQDWAGVVHLLKSTATLVGYVPGITNSYVDPAAHSELDTANLNVYGSHYGFGYTYIQVPAPFTPRTDTPPVASENHALDVWNHWLDPTSAGQMAIWGEAQNYNVDASNNAGVFNVGITGVASDTPSSEVAGTDGLDYKCILSHTASSSNGPPPTHGVGTYWALGGGYGHQAWVTGTSYSSAGTGQRSLIGLQGYAYTYGTGTGTVEGVLGRGVFQSTVNSFTGRHLAGVVGQAAITTDGSTPLAQGTGYAFVANPGIGGAVNWSFYGNDPLWVARTSTPFSGVETIPAALYGSYIRATQPTDIQAGLYGLSENSGSATATTGHLIGVMGVVTDTTGNTFMSYGVEGRVNSIAQNTGAYVQGVLGMGTWQGASNATGPISIVGVQADAHACLAAGTCAVGDSNPNVTSVVQAVAFYASPVTGGQYQYSFKGFNPVQVQATTVGALPGVGFIIADASTGNPSVELLTTTYAASQCGSLSGAAGCWQIILGATPHYIPYW